MSPEIADFIVVLLSVAIILMGVIIFYIRELIVGEHFQRFMTKTTVSNMETLLVDTLRYMIGDETAKAKVRRAYTEQDTKK